MDDHSENAPEPIVVARPRAQAFESPEHVQVSPLDTVANEQRLRLLISSVKDYAIFMLDAKGCITSWNPGAERIKGYHASDVIGKHIAMFYTREDLEAKLPQRLLEEAARSGRVEHEGWRVRKDGTRFWADVIISAIQDDHGAIVGFAKVTRDLTERKAAENALRLSEARLAATLYSIGDGVIATDENGAVTRLNRAAQMLTGWTEEDALGRPIAEVFRIIDEETRTPATSAVERVLREGVEVGLTRHTALIARDGTERAIEDNGAPIRDASGRISGAVHVFKDVTIERRSERALMESEARLRLMIASVKDHAIFMLDPFGHVVSWNPGAERIKGYAAHEIVGQHFSRFYVEEDRRAGKPDLALATARTSGRWEDESWRVRKDGSLFWANVVISAVRDLDGRLLGFTKVVRDLTERKAAHEAAVALAREQAARAASEAAQARLRESEERYRELSERLEVILHGVTDGITVQDTSAQLIYANEAAVRMLGSRSLEELRSTPLAEVAARFESVDEHGRPVSYDRYPGRMILRGLAPEPLLVHVRERATGREWWNLVQARGVKHRDGRPTMVVNIMHDVTRERRQHEGARLLALVVETLNESFDPDERLAALARVLVMDFADWCAIDLLDGAQVRLAAVAHRAPEMVKKAVELRKRYPPDLNAATGVPNVIRTGRAELHAEITDAMLVKSARDDEHLAIARDLRLASAIVVPLAAHGITFGAMSLFNSKTKRRFDEFDLGLAQEISQHAAVSIENARLYRETKEAVRAREDVLAVVSHDLRNPLSSIVIGAATMQRSAGVDEGRPYRRSVDAIMRAAQRMSRQIEDLLDFDSIARGTLKIDLAPESAESLIEDAREQIEPLAAERQIDLHIEPSEPSPAQIVCDRGRILQVLENILSNAIKVTPAGGSVSLTLAFTADAVRFSVSDGGPGIAEDALARIFDRYWRAENAPYKGRGLGLAIARGIVGAHRGRIWAENNPGGGAKFSFELPLERPAGGRK